MKFICIFLCLLATAVALEAPESFLRGSDVNRDLRGNKILFTSGACQRELSVCEASLLKSDGWESVLASSGNAKIQAIAATSTDYESIVAGFAQLTTRERAQNAARVIPEITTSVAAIQKSEDTDDKKKIVKVIEVTAEIIVNFVLFVVGTPLEIVIAIGTSIVDFINGVATGDATLIVTSVITGIYSFLSALVRNVRTINLFRNADGECMAKLMSCNEKVFLSTVVPQLISLSSE